MFSRHSNLSYKKKSGNYENSTGSYRVNTSDLSAYSYAEKIAIHIKSIDSILYLTKNWSNTTSRHQSHISGDLQKYISGPSSTSKVFYLKNYDSANQLRHDITKKELKDLILKKDIKNRFFESSDDLQNFLELFCTKKQAEKHLKDLKKYEAEKKAINKLHEAKQRAKKKLANFDLNYKDEKQLSKALENYEKKFQVRFDFTDFNCININVYRFDYLKSVERLKLAILKFNNFFKANYQNMTSPGHSDYVKKTAFLNDLINEIEAQAVTASTFKTIGQESEPLNA